MFEMREKIDSVVLGCDLGKIRDYTALCAIEKVLQYSNEMGNNSPVGEPEYRLKYLERFPLNTDYDQQVDYTQLIFNDAVSRYNEKHTSINLVIDATGPGLPMLDHFKKAIPSCKGVYITAGSQVNREGSVFFVPKKDLVTNLQIIMQGRRLKFGKGIPEAEILKTELQNFSYKTTEAGNTTFEHWRERDHDDCVLAVAIALWYLNHNKKFSVCPALAELRRGL